MITGKNCIAGEFKGQGNVVFRTFNPKKNIENPTAFLEATPEEIEQAVEAAWAAFKTFRKVSGERRAAFLNAIADEILALDQELLDAYTSESGLPEVRAIGERGRTMGQLRAFATLVSKEDWRGNTFDRAEPDRKPLPKCVYNVTMRPSGTVEVFGATNLVLDDPTERRDTPSALAAGCPLQVQYQPVQAGTSELFPGALVRAAVWTCLPKGQFSSVH